MRGGLVQGAAGVQAMAGLLPTLDDALEPPVGGLHRGQNAAAPRGI